MAGSRESVSGRIRGHLKLSRMAIVTGVVETVGGALLVARRGVVPVLAVLGLRGVNSAGGHGFELVE